MTLKDAEKWSKVLLGMAINLKHMSKNEKFDDYAQILFSLAHKLILDSEA